MNRRQFLQSISCTVLGAMAGGAMAAEAADHEPRRPNLLYVFADELRAQALGYMGLEPVKTPRLDAFAQESVNLTQAISNYPVCVPYRTILMSGRYPFGNGVYVNCFWDGRQMPESLVWWPEVLKRNGYATAYLGKWHISVPDRRYQGKKVAGTWLSPKRRHGFDLFYCHDGNHHLRNRYVHGDWPCDRSETVEQWTPEHETDVALRWLENKDGVQRDPSKPFALVVSWNPPHSPYHLHPERYMEPYGALDVEMLCTKAPDVPSKGTRWGEYYRKQILHYYAAITGIDEQFGRLLDGLKRLGLERDTIVVFTSDHGNCLGRHGEISKNNHYEESLRIPLLFRWPGKIPARKDPLLFSVADMYPTLLGLVGLAQEAPKGLDGADLSGILRGEPGPRPAFQPYYGIERSVRATGKPDYDRRGIRTERHTLVLRYDNDGTLAETWLYDHVADPFEQHNLAQERPEVVRDLTERYLRPWLKQTKDSWLNNLPPTGAAPIAYLPQKEQKAPGDR